MPPSGACVAGGRRPAVLSHKRQKSARNPAASVPFSWAPTPGVKCATRRRYSAATECRAAALAEPDLRLPQPRQRPARRGSPHGPPDHYQAGVEITGGAAAAWRRRRPLAALGLGAARRRQPVLCPACLFAATAVASVKWPRLGSRSRADPSLTSFTAS